MPTFVQAPTPVHSSAAATTMSLTYGSNNTAGNCLVAITTWDVSLSQALSSVTDTVGNTWTQVGVTNTDVSSGQAAAVFVCLNCKAASSNQVTVTWAASTSARGLLLMEYSGVGAIDTCLGQVATNTTATNNVTTPSATTTAGGDKIIGLFVDTSSTANVVLGTDQSYSQRAFIAGGSSLPSMLAEDIAIATPNTVSASATIGTAGIYISYVLALRAPGPTLIAAYSTASSAQDTTTLTTPSFTPANGEVIVVKIITETDSKPLIGVTSGGSQTYTVQVNDNTASRCQIQLSTAVVSGSPGSMTVSQTFTGTGGRHSMVVERWGNAQLAATPATLKVISGSSGAPSGTITTTQNNSAVSWINGDRNAVNPSTEVYVSGALQDGIDDQHGGALYVAYYAYQLAATAGSQTVGMSSPGGQLSSLAGIEIQAASTPWINRTLLGGTSIAQNGTASHTVTFTPATAGNFLVAVMGGAITFSTPTGWTLVNDAASSNGVYVFSKTASASESTFSTTHNGSNYNILGIVYEFAAGSSIPTSSQDQSMATTATTPTLTGLTGTYTTFSVRGWTMATGTVTYGSAAWAAPSIKDYDAFVLRGGSPTQDGTALAIAYNPGQTGASFIPSSVYSFNGSGAGSGTNGAGVSWALHLPAGGAASVVLSWFRM